MRKIALWLLLALVALAGVGAPPLIYTGLEADVYPELRAGRVFAPISPVCKALGAGVAWNPDTGEVRITRADGPELVLTLGSTTATAGGKAVTLDAAPYVKQGRTMVPVRFLAEALGVPVAYHAATRTVRFPVGDRLYILPLPDTHPTIVFENPAPGATVGSPILVQGVGSAWEGDFPIELYVNGERVANGIARCGVSGLHPFSIRLSYANTSGKTLDAVIVASDQSGEEGTEPEKHTLKVRLLPTE
ncbi:MAG: stalk domain-containing protein [Armatimonadota bacterium]